MLCPQRPRSLSTALDYGRRPDKEDFSKKLRVHVPLDCTLEDAMRDRAYVIAGVPPFYLVVAGSAYYRERFALAHQGVCACSSNRAVAATLNEAGG